MTRVHYLGQYSSSDDEEGPCKLPNGRLVCGPHGLVVCGKCCTDYSFMDDLLDDDDDDDDDDDEDLGEDKDEEPAKLSVHALDCLDAGIKNVRGTGKVFPSMFVPSNSSAPPLEEFPNRRQHIHVLRRTHSHDDSMVLLMADGACLDSGQPNPKAGWAFFQGEGIDRQPLIVSGRLENRGPWGDQGSQTSNRAELRAVLAALRFRHWRGEGFKTVVFATDSSYVVDGATQWVRSWVNNGWKTKGRNGSGGGADVKNKDLWEMLLGECERAHGFGLVIRFWKIPLEWNTLADEGAKKAAAERDASDRWRDIMGLAI